MKTQDDIGWSVFYGYRKEIRKTYPSNYDIEIKKKFTDVITAEIKEGDKVLDVGASNKEAGKKIKKARPSITYRTMDIDRSHEHDYYSLDNIPGKFDVIILSEVIEHLPFQDGMELLGKLNNLLVNRGRLIVSTPNVHHPNRYRDPDHKTPYRYDAIGGALIYSGFAVEKIYRIYNDQFIRRFIRMYLMAWLHRYLDVDFAKSIAVVALKK